MSVDRRTDDTGIEAVIIVGTALALTLAAPRVAIAIALGVGLPVAALNGGVPALVLSCAGAGIGYALRRSAATRSG